MPLLSTTSLDAVVLPSLICLPCHCPSLSVTLLAAFSSLHSLQTHLTVSSTYVAYMLSGFFWRAAAFSIAIPSVRLSITLVIHA